jgi:iron complex outermembrane receptor protein
MPSPLLLSLALIASDIPDLGSESAVFDDAAPFVIGASRRRQSLEDVPEAVTVITAEEIRRYGWRTITEVLANVRGLYVMNDGNYSYAGVRGFARPGDYNTRILLLINGHAMNDATYQASLLGRETGLDMDLIERVEVIRGPGSALYGTNALLAVINLVTRTGPDVRHLEGFGFRASVEKDASDTKVSAAYDKLLTDELRLLASASYEMDEGRSFDFTGIEGSQFAGPTDPSSDALHASNFYAQVSYGPLSVMGLVNHHHKHVPTASFASIPEAGQFTVDTHALIEPKLELQLSEYIDITARTFLDYTYYHGFNPYSLADGGDYTDTSKGLAGGADLTFALHLDDLLELVAGATAQHFFYIDIESHQPRIPFDFFETYSYSSYAVYANADLRLSSMLTLSGGIRYDWYGTFGDRASPRIALIMRPVSGTTFKLMYAQAFRAPSIYELYYRTYEAPTAPDLRPEVLHHAAAVAEQELGGGRGLLTLAVYRYSMSKLIEAVGEDALTFTFENRSSATGTGAELEISGRLPFLGIRASAGYTFAHVTDGDTGARLSNAPAHVLQFRGMLPIYENQIFLAAAARYIGDRDGLEGRTGADSAFTADLTLTADDLSDGLDLSIGASNIFNQAWFVPSSIEHAPSLIPQNGRTVWAKLSYLF